MLEELERPVSQLVGHAQGQVHSAHAHGQGRLMLLCLTNNLFPLPGAHQVIIFHQLIFLLVIALGNQKNGSGQQAPPHAHSHPTGILRPRRHPLQRGNCPDNEQAQDRKYHHREGHHLRETIVEDTAQQTTQGIRLEQRAQPHTDKAKHKHCHTQANPPPTRSGLTPPDYQHIHRQHPHQWSRHPIHDGDGTQGIDKLLLSI